VTLAERSLHLLRDPRVVDPVASALLAITSLYALWNPSPLLNAPYREADALGVVLVLLSTGAVAFRTRWPVAMLVLCASTSLLHAQLGYSQGLGSFAPLLVLYTVAVARPLRWSVALTVATMAGLGLALATSPFEVTLSDWVTNLIVVAAAWGIGRSVRIRRDHQANLEARNRALVEVRQAETDRMLVEERARTARELQDLVAHNLTEVSVQIAAARRVMSRDPGTAEAMLLEAERLGRVALDEMRRSGGLLETDGSSAQLRPQPGLDDLDDLIERTRAEGATLTWHTTGTPAPVPQGVALAAYRFVEEAIEGFRSTRGDTPLDVAVAWTDHALEVTVTTGADAERISWDEPRVPEATLSRLRTRIEAYGGTLDLVHRRDSTTRLVASIPRPTERPTA
jgi:signal transduction histidine kinase